MLAGRSRPSVQHRRWAGDRIGSGRSPLEEQVQLQPAVLDHDDEVSAISFGPDGRVATGTAANITRLWSLNDPSAEPEVLEQSDFGNDKAQWKRLRSAPTDVCWPPAAVTSGSGCGRWTFRVPPRSRESRSTLESTIWHSCPRGPLGIADEGGSYLAMGSGGAVVRKTEGPCAEVLSLGLQPGRPPVGHRKTPMDGRSWSGISETWESLRSTPLPRRQVPSLAFDGEGRQLASGSWDETVQIWEVDTRSYITLNTDGRVDDVALRSMGSCFAVAAETSNYGTSLPATDDPIANPAVLRDHTRSCTVGFSLDGRWLATGSEDHSVRLVAPAGGTDRAGLCERAGRNLSQEEVGEV